MNKIFKVIWSKSKQCYIVVSEMAKNHSGKKKIVVASILAAMAVGSDALVTDVSAARASVSLAGGNTVTDGTIAIGSGSYSDGTAIGGDGARRVEPGIAIGVDAKAQGNSNIVMGQGAQIIGHSFGVAIGRTAQATDDYGVSVGYNTHADLHGIAMGEQSRAKKTGATSFGVSSRGYGNGAIAVGWQSLAGANVYDEKGVPNDDINSDNGKTINDYDKWGDVAIGVRTIATGGNATALGRGATASAANAIAIGGGDGGEPTKSGNTASDNKEKTKATAEKAVAIGYKALASDKNATSIGTDAQATQARATAIGYEVRAVGKNAVAIGSSGENSSRKLNSAGENAISIGTAAQANNLGSTAIGNLALASSNHAVAIGTSAEGTGASSTAIGHLVKATESNAFAAGSESLASGKNSISIGSTFNNITNQSTGEASIAIGAAAQSTGAGSVALGRNVQALKEYTTAVGMNIKASDNASASTILGYNSYTKANQSVNIGSTVKTEAGGQYSTAIGYTLSVSGKNAIGIGSSDDGITDDKKLMATGESSIAIGTRAQGKASGATAIGKEAVASHTDAIALGTSAQGTGEASTAIGNGAKATNSHAFAAGVGANAAGNSAIAVGNSASAAKDNSVAIGTNTTASEIETVAVGLRASAQGKRSVSLGIDTESTTADGVSVGYLSKSQALGAVAIGRNAVVTAEKSTAVGYDLTVSNSASTNIGYTSTVAANQATSVGARNSVESGAQYGTALGYFVNISGKNAIGIGSSDDKQNVVASAYNAAAIGTSAQATASSAMALGTNANAALAHSVALGEGSTTTEADGAGKTAYLSGESTNNSGNGVISVGNKRNDSDRTATITRRIVSVAGGTDDFDAVNVKQLKALESKERHIKVKTGNDAYTPDANGKITLNYVNGKGEDVPNEVTEIKDVAKKSDEWTLRTQDGNTTAVATPQTVNGLTKKAVTLKAGDNIAIENNNGVVTIKAKDVVKSVATDNTNALDISNTNGAVKINPKLASSVNAAGEANKLVTAGTVKTALDDKIDKTAEMHIKSGEYTVNTDGTASLIQQNGNNQDQSTRVTIKDIAKKSVVDTLQSDYNTFRTKAITFTGDDNQGVARTLDTTLTVKGGANYTSTIPNTNIRVEKDGTTGLAVKLSDKLTGIKEISGTGSQDLVINNGNTKVTVKAPSNGDNGTVDFGNAKVVAPNLDASISYKAGNGDTKKTVKLQDGFNFTAATDTTTTAEGPKSGLAIKAEDNGKVTFGLDKATRNTIDNAADKNLSNLTQDGKNKVTELAKTAAKEAVKVAPGLNTTVTTDTSTAGVTTYKVNANDTTVAAGSEALTINNATPDTNKVRAYTVDLSAVTKGKLAAVGNLATNVIGGTTIAADGTVTGPTFSITNAAGTAENAGTIKEAIEKLDAANKGQNTKISDTAEKVTNLATALGGGAKVENGTFTGPTYNITKADGTGTETASNVGEAITKLDTRITTANGTLVTKGLDFTGNDTTNAGKVHRDLGTTLTIKGAENFTRAATENNIKVVKNGDALDVKLAENLAKMKEISGDGTSDLVIKNGDTKITVKAPANGDKGTVDFGDAKVVASNLDASIKYRANDAAAANAKSVKLADGFNFVASNVTDTAAEGPKSGLAITAGDNGKVTFGLDKATRVKVDNAADKNLSNLSDDGKNKVKELAKTAAQDAVKVADGINTTVTTDTTTTAGVTTYKVNANDTTVAIKGDGLAITGGELGTDKVRKYSLDLSATTKGKLAAVGNLATNVIGGTTIAADGTVTGPTFSITNAEGTAENVGTIKAAIEKLDAANKGQNTKISETAGKVTALDTKVDGIVEKGMVFAGDDATADKVTRKLGETLNIHGQNNITVKKDDTAADTLNVKLASDLKNITSISSGDGTTGSKVTLGADGVSIANTKDGATKTVTIDKDGINAGGMKVTNVADAEKDGDAANKKYVDNAISNLNTTVTNNANLRYAGDTNEGAAAGDDHLNLPLATGTLKVAGTADQIKTVAN
uniref:ESPR-type extended signal peptide-containing protein n=1 Tax=Veillonella sp. CNR 79/14 TaxID=2490954 RepID=UPI0013DF3BF3